MVVASECRMRLQEFADIGGGYLDDLPLSIMAMSPKLLTLHVVGKPADVKAFAEIDAPTNELAVTTAVAIEHLSADALDKNAAAGAVRTYNSIGIDGNDEIITREEAMDATDGTTETATTNVYKDCFHAYATLWGNQDDDAEGKIDIRKLDDTILVSIPLGDNESNGARFRVPDDHVAMLYGGTLTRHASAADEGVIIRLIYIDAVDALLGLAADRAINWIDFSVGLYTTHLNIPKGQMFEEGSQISLWHSSMVDLGEDYDLKLNFLIWKK